MYPMATIATRPKCWQTRFTEAQEIDVMPIATFYVHV